MNESNLSARRAYDRFQFAFSMFSLAMIFASLIAVAFFDVKSYVIVIPIAVYFFISIVAGMISGFHVGMIFLPRVGHIKVEEHPKLFWGGVVMLVLVAALFSLIVASNLYASEASLKSIGLETTDASGCYLTDGNESFPTIGAMVAAFGTPGLRSEVVLEIISIAAKSGCNIHTPDSAGLSPLNAAILFNEPDLVSLLLGYGADPYRKITSSKESLNGLDSFAFIELLIKKKQDRTEIKSILEKAI